MLSYGHICLCFPAEAVTGAKHSRRLLYYGGSLLLAVGTAIVFYILIGYRFCLPIVSGFRPRAERYGFQTTVSVLLAVHNGEQFIRKKLECLLASNYPAELMEILWLGWLDGCDRGHCGVVFGSRRASVRAPRVVNRRADWVCGTSLVKSCFSRMFAGDPSRFACHTWWRTLLILASVPSPASSASSNRIVRERRNRYGYILALRAVGPAAARRNIFGLQYHGLHLRSPSRLSP